MPNMQYETTRKINNNDLSIGYLLIITNIGVVNQNL